MKILFDHPSPFLFAHGGFQIQIEQTMKSLRDLGVQVEYLRWWDDQQNPDLIHYFGRPSSSYINFAHQKGIKVVIAPLLAGLGARPSMVRFGQKIITRGLEAALPNLLTAHFGWNSFRIADGCIALTAWEAQLMKEIFRAPFTKTHVLSNGVETVFFNDAPPQRGPWLVCTATIRDLKRVLEVSHAAVRAKTPLWVIGKAYSDSDRYARRFFEFARKNSDLIRYQGPIDDRNELAHVYREARGFVLLSKMETLSLSALEAAASGCPLLLSDLPWARAVFKEKATYCPIKKDANITASVMRNFYDSCPALPIPIKPKTWREVGVELSRIYDLVANVS